jgi:hypothetical protein
MVNYVPEIEEPYFEASYEAPSLMLPGAHLRYAWPVTGMLRTEAVEIESTSFAIIHLPPRAAVASPGHKNCGAVCPGAIRGASGTRKNPQAKMQVACAFLT